MKFTKALLLSAALLSLATSSVGCSTGSSFGLASLRSPRQSFGSAQLSNAFHGASQRNYVDTTANNSPTRIAKMQTATSPANQHAQVAFNQTLQPVSHAPLASPLITLGANDDFQQLIDNASGVVLVDFYADWCGPCRKQGGILHEMESSASQNRASIIKVNVDQHKDLARKFGVSGLPTLILIKSGKVVERQTGLADRRTIAALLAR